MAFSHAVGGTTWAFADLKELMAKATPPRSGDMLAGIAAGSAGEGMAARCTLADLPLKALLAQPLIPYEDDDVTRLIIDRHDDAAFAPLSHLTVGDFRDWLLSDLATPAMLARIAPGVTPEMAAAVSKIMRIQDLILAAKKCRVVTRFRDTVGLPGTMAVRLQPNHPTDDPDGIAAAVAEGLLYGCGDAVIGINPASDSPAVLARLCHLLDELIARHEIPTQACVLTHATTTIGLIESGVPVDLVFQSIAGTQAANASFGVTLGLLGEARDAGLSQKRGTVGTNVMYFETGQGSALSAGAHHGVDQQTLEARAYAVARAYEPLLVNTVVGFIGPEYLYDGKQITRAGLEDHFCGKLMGLPLGCDVCYTNHAEADADDMDALMTLLGAAGVAYIMGVPGADDVMLNYQSTSFHDQLYLRDALGLKRAPEFEAWLQRMGITDPTAAAQPDGVASAADTARDRVSAAAERPAPPVTPDPWTDLAGLTPARLALGRSGASLPTREVLKLGLAHAKARDAVHDAADFDGLAAGLAALGHGAVAVESAAPDRATYLRRPDLGRRLSASSRAALEARGPAGEAIAIVVADGLSATAVDRNALALLDALLPRLASRGIGPVVLARQGRVALGDEVGALLGARLTVMLIGERPGLSAADSLGAYLTFGPRVGLTDAARNCVSNIRAGGLLPEAAAGRIAWLVDRAFALSLTGVALKDESDALAGPDATGSLSV